MKDLYTREKAASEVCGDVYLCQEKKFGVKGFEESVELMCL